MVIAVLAHGLIGLSLVWDKVLLNRRGTQNLFGYVFWLGAISIFGVVLFFFGYRNPELWVIGLGFLAGVLDLVASFFYYLALKRGEVSEALAVMGGFAPIATAGFAYVMLTRQMTTMEAIGFAIMSAGGFCMFFSEKLELRKLLPPVLLASALFGLVNVLEKIVYNNTNFVSGFVWFTLGTFFGSIAMLIVPSWRRQILAESKKDETTKGEPSRNRFWYFVNRFVNGLGSFLTVYAISLANPALVSAISGVRYVVIFLGALMLTKLWPRYLKEDFRPGQLIAKGVATALVVIGVAIAGMGGNKSTGTALKVPQKTLRLVGYVRAHVFVHQFGER